MCLCVGGEEISTGRSGGVREKEKFSDCHARVCDDDSLTLSLSPSLSHVVEVAAGFSRLHTRAESLDRKKKGGLAFSEDGVVVVGLPHRH